MSDYEIIGRVTVWIGAAMFFLACVAAVQWLAWFAFKEIIGWPRVFKALKLLHESERTDG